MPLDAEHITRSATQAANQCLDHCLEVITHCVGQMSEEQIWWRPVPSMNSVGNLLLHLEGNIRQWIIAGLTEAQDTRNRPAEFSMQGGRSKSELLDQLQKTVIEAREVLGNLTPEQSLAERTIQGFAVTGWEAVFDSVPHFKGHAQEIVCLTRLQLGSQYQFRWEPNTPEEGASAG